MHFRLTGHHGISCREFRLGLASMQHPGLARAAVSVQVAGGWDTLKLGFPDSRANTNVQQGLKLATPSIVNV
jgi:hypothetical protein